MITSGSSVITARPIASVLSARPGPLEPVIPSAPPKEAPLADGELLALRVAGVDPEHQPQRVEVLAAARVLGRDAGPFHRLADQVLEVDLDHPVVVERPVRQRILVPAGAVEVGLLEGGLV